MKGTSSKGSVISQPRMGRDSPLCETHDCINDISTLAQEHLPVTTIAGVAA